MKKFFAVITSAILVGCGSGGDDEGFFWDGFNNFGQVQWSCRDANNGQFAANWMCADQKVNDHKWPTDGVQRETNLWFKGVSIRTICKESIEKFLFSNKGTYVRTEQSGIYVPGLGYQDDAVYSQHWNQSANASWSMLYKFDENNWAVFVIRAKNTADFWPAECRAYVMNNGTYEGYKSI